MMRSFGIDVSYYDHPIDWEQAASVVDFAFIKASEGTVVDRLFREQWGLARGHVLRGPYHFFRPKIDPVLSVEALLGYLGGDKGELPAVLDVETTDGRDDTWDRARDWCAAYKRGTGDDAIIYSSPGFMDGSGAAEKIDSRTYRHAWLKNHDSWVAQWYWDSYSEAMRIQKLEQVLKGEIIPSYPVALAPWTTTPAWWQWTAKGMPSYIPGYYHGPGEKLAIDFNFYMGTRADLHARYGKPRGGTMPTYAFKIAPLYSDGCSIRPEPDTGSTPLATKLAYGQVAYGNKKITITANKWEYVAGVEKQVNQAGDTWLEVLEVNGTVLSAPAYVAEVHLGRRIATITQIGTPPAEPPPPEPNPVLTVSSIAIMNPERVTITYSDGSVKSFP